jgi:hypothetical protein
MPKIFRIGLYFAALALALSWLLLAESSPAHDWLLVHPRASNLAMAANLPAYLAAVLVSGNAHAPDNALINGAMAVQWILVGQLFAWGYSRLRPNNSFKPNPLRGSA